MSASRSPATSSAAQRISRSATSWWWRCPAPCCPATSPSPRARPTAALSDGMICSAAELELGRRPFRHPGAAAGYRRARRRRAADILGLDDVVFHLAITPDRGYCLSVRGLAREIACAYDLDYVDPADVPAAARRGRGVAADHPARHRGAALRAASRHRHRPGRGVAVVDAAAAADERHPRHLTGRRRDQLRDARTRPSDARPRSQPDHRRASTCGSPATAKTVVTLDDVERTLDAGRRADRRRRRDRRHRRRDGCGHHRGPRQHHRCAAGGRGVGSGRGVAHPAAPAPGQRGRPSLRTRPSTRPFPLPRWTAAPRCWPRSPAAPSNRR